MSSIRRYADSSAVAEAAAEALIATGQRAIAERGRFSLALSGGSTPRALHQCLARPDMAARLDWSRVWIFFGDERCVPPDHPDSNYLMAEQTLLRHVGVPAAQIFRMAGEQPPTQAAAQYESTLRGLFAGSPSLDLILLGIGDDGHTASLFPGTAAVHERERWVVAHYVEKLAAWRITLTPVVLNAAAMVLFVVTGSAKAERLRQVITGPRQPDDMPAQIVRPTAGQLLWFVDASAAAALPPAP